MVVKSLLDDYYDWLLEQVDIFLPEHRNYERLLRELNSVEFTWVIPMDENRDMDAVELRKEYLFDCGYHRYDLWTTPRSVLEVLIAFSRRIEIEITGEPGNDDLSRWFWVMIDNLGLLKFSDDRFIKEEVDKILEKWLSHLYKKNGKGSIFLTHKTDIDFREMEMWYQMHTYLNENWSF